MGHLHTDLANYNKSNLMNFRDELSQKHSITYIPEEGKD